MAFLVGEEREDEDEQEEEAFRRPHFLALLLRAHHGGAVAQHLPEREGDGAGTCPVQECDRAAWTSLGPSPPARSEPPARRSPPREHESTRRRRPGPPFHPPPLRCAEDSGVLGSSRFARARRRRTCAKGPRPHFPALAVPIASVAPGGDSRLAGRPRARGYAGSDCVRRTPSIPDSVCARTAQGDSKSDMEVLDREVRQLTTDLEELRRDMDDYGVCVPPREG